MSTRRALYKTVHIFTCSVFPCFVKCPFVRGRQLNLLLMISIACVGPKQRLASGQTLSGTALIRLYYCMDACRMSLEEEEEAEGEEEE